MYFNCVDFIYCVSMFVYTIMLLAVCHIIIIIIIIQHLYSAIMSYADTEALVAPVKSE